MPNDPERSTYQMWVIPREIETRIIREKEDWYIEIYGGARFPIDARQALLAVEGIESYRAEQWQLRKKERSEKERD